MAEVRRRTDASPSAVWGVLANGWYYPAWVVGATRMRAVSEDWPTAGATLHHSVGVWPGVLNDSTHVLECTPLRELVLRGRAWPAGEARIQIVIEPAPNGGCEVIMREDAVSGPALLMPRSLRALLIYRRNIETMQRLVYIAEHRPDDARV